jgi:hypothetical protein
LFALALFALQALLLKLNLPLLLAQRFLYRRIDRSCSGNTRHK